MSAAPVRRGRLASRRGALLQILLISLTAIALPNGAWRSVSVPLLLAGVGLVLAWLAGGDWYATGFGRPSRRAIWWVVTAVTIGGLWQYAAVGFVSPLAARLLNSPPPASPVPAGAVGVLFSVATYCLVDPLAKGLAYRGLLLNRLERLLGSGLPAIVISVLLASIVFGLTSWRQGPAAVVTGALTGAVFNALYYWAGRNVWPSSLAQAVFNGVALTLLYLAYL